MVKHFAICYEIIAGEVARIREILPSCYDRCGVSSDQDRPSFFMRNDEMFLFQVQRIKVKIDETGTVSCQDSPTDLRREMSNHGRISRKQYHKDTVMACRHRRGVSQGFMALSTRGPGESFPHYRRLVSILYPAHKPHPLVATVPFLRLWPCIRSSDR
ncbi:hypothetical protein HYDPIDRAFT_38711 [Hydnomerulius pinastri MD-312]|nr:hypothetical protein HYDPIDRAFT_38711 [Hydnomerulius pinastri MD-312]